MEPEHSELSPLAGPRLNGRVILQFDQNVHYNAA